MPEGLSPLRFGAASGLAGALTLFAGDMLFYGRWGSGSQALTSAFDIAVSRADIWAVASALIAPVAGLLYFGSLGFLNEALNGASVLWRRFVVVGMAFIFATAIATHAVWAAAALSSDAAVMDLLASLFLVGQLVAVPTSGILFVLTLLGRTSWPRWFVLLNPGLAYLILATAAWLPPPLGFPIVGGAFNLAMAIFFAASLAATRRTPRLSSD